MTDIYTHKDLAALCSVSETTIKSYRRKFPGFIPVLTQGKPIRFRKEAGDVCLTIRDCFEKGMSVKETAKVLKQRFKEQPVKPPDVTSQAKTMGSPGGVSSEYLEKFFQTAGQMMQGMASLATAQAKSNQRLEHLEKAISKLVETEARNSEQLTDLIGLLKKSSPLASGDQAGPKPTTLKPEKKVKRTIVNVKGAEGNIKSYAFETREKHKSPKPEHPSEAFLDTPIVIMNEQGEFLGVPGRLSVSGFVERLVREAEEGRVPHSHWHQQNDGWIFSMEVADGNSHDLFFMSTTTPRGNLVVLLDRLDVNGKKTSPQFLQEFFRQVKDKG